MSQETANSHVCQIIIRARLDKRDEQFILTKYSTAGSKNQRPGHRSHDFSLLKSKIFQVAAVSYNNLKLIQPGGLLICRLNSSPGSFHWNLPETAGDQN